ncbi:hypothetical protein D3C72_1161960 [compost metagenome]
MQSFDEDLFADTGFAMDQQRNVFLQQTLSLAHSFLHATVAEVQGAEADSARGWF